MNCKTCGHRGESPISGTCEGCVKGSKHSDKTSQPTVKNCPIYEAISRKLSGFATVPAFERSKMMVRAAKAAKEAAAPRVIELEKRVAELESELEEYASLIKLQHRRSVKASKLWQKAHNKPGVWPDLGELLAWLLERIGKMKCCENCKHYSDIGEFSPDYVCHIVKEKCTVEKYESWELKE